MYFHFHIYSFPYFTISYDGDEVVCCVACCTVCSVMLVMHRIFIFILAHYFLSNDVFRIEEKQKLILFSFS
jgi:hypothetical protein